MVALGPYGDDIVEWRSAYRSPDLLTAAFQGLTPGHGAGSLQEYRGCQCGKCTDDLSADAIRAARIAHLRRCVVSYTGRPGYLARLELEALVGAARDELAGMPDSARAWTDLAALWRAENAGHGILG